jgi:hypothetical protein
MMSYKIRLLVYDHNTHQFRSGLDIQRCLPDGRQSSVSLEEARKEGIAPSESWMQDYIKWNSHDDGECAFKGHPVFSSRKALFEFDDAGVILSTRLRHELEGRGVEVEDFQPLYSNIEVGDALSGWWHIKDKNYGFVIPIQHLPVSDELKSRLMNWRFRKGRDCLNRSACDSLNKEGRDLEEHILWELNVRTREIRDEEVMNSTSEPSCESVQGSTTVLLSNLQLFVPAE